MLVRVLAGPHKGKCGKLVGYKTGRAIVILGKEHVSFTVDYLEPAPPEKEKRK